MTKTIHVQFKACGTNLARHVIDRHTQKDRELKGQIVFCQN